MTGMPRNFRPIIGSRYAGPHLDRPSLRQLPSGWVIEEARKPTPAWWRFWADPNRIIGWLCVVILVYAAMSAINQARAGEADMRIAGRAVAETVNQMHKVKPINPVWSIKRCKAQGRTFVANLSDDRGWKVRCTGRPVRT